MGHAHAIDPKIENPGFLKVSGVLKGICSLLIVIGVISFFIAYGSDPTHAWTSFLEGHFFCMELAVMGIFFPAIHWITTSMWSSPVRRIAEGLTSYLPVALVTTLLVILGSHSIFQWTHLDQIKNDPVITGKLGYLNITFFSIRAFVGLLGWMWFAKKIVGSSVAADSFTDHGEGFKKVYESNRRWSVGFVVFFAITFSAISFDQLMSLDPHFFSTLFGVYIFAGAFQTFFAVLAILTIILRRTGYLKQVVNHNHMHDIGKMMITFTIFWAYTCFAQYMLIWYANLPEETGFFLVRFNPGWEFWSLALFVGKFFVPFFLLLPRANKRSDLIMMVTGIWIVLMQFFELVWMVQPQVRQQGIHVDFTDIGIWLGFLGLFALVFIRFFKKRNILAITDPYLPDSAFHHHVQ